jgi:stress response protein SCP2
MPGLTSAGRPTLKTLTKRDRTHWWLTVLGSNLIATVKEALATAPGITAVELAVLTRLPETHRLGVVAFGRWTRPAIESTIWREPGDALRFLDLGEDVTCDVSTSPPRPLSEQPLTPGENLVLPEEASDDLILTFGFIGADADLTLLLLARNRTVRSDDDFVFYNQPIAAEGAARLLGKQSEGEGTAERASLRLSALPSDVHRIAISMNMAVDVGLTCAALHEATLRITSPTSTWTIPTPADPQIKAMVLAETYRHTVDGQQIWKLRAVGQGWADGLAGLARDHGVDVA